VIDVSGAFNGFTQAISIDRTATGTRDANGRWVDGGITNITINAVVQVANADDVQILPEGERTNEIIKVHSISLMQTASESGQDTADLINYQGKQYKVMSDFNRATLGGYYKALAVRND